MTRVLRPGCGRVLGLSLTALLLGGCAAGDADPAAGGVEEELTVFAAASLTDALKEAGSRLEDQRPRTRVTVNVAGSQVLLAQLREGAHADLYLPAGQQLAEVAVEEGLAERAVPVATNRLAIAVEPGNPRQVRGLADLARDDLLVVLPAQAVPAGSAAREALATAGVDVSPVSLESDVRAVLSKVALGEADAGVVYRSDVVAADGRVQGIELPDELAPAVPYRGLVLTEARHPAAAEALLDLLRSERGAAILADAGFSPR